MKSSIEEYQHLGELDQYVFRDSKGVQWCWVRKLCLFTAFRESTQSSALQINWEGEVVEDQIWKISQEQNRPLGNKKDTGINIRTKEETVKGNHNLLNLKRQKLTLSQLLAARIEKLSAKKCGYPLNKMMCRVIWDRGRVTFITIIKSDSGCILIKKAD